MKIGILALQGDVREHVNILNRLEVETIKVTLPEHLQDIDALIIPGGESTTISLLMKKYNIDKKIKQKHKEGMPIYGTCAGAILLANNIIKNNQNNLGLLDVSLERNAYGRQLDSFETDLNIKNIGNIKGIFIRAPIIKGFSNGAEVLAEHNNAPVMLKQNNVLITTFHPELADDVRVHKYFLEMAKEYKEIRDMQGDIEKN